MFNGAFLLGLIILAVCVWWACRTAPVVEGDYSRLDRLDGLGDHDLIRELVADKGGSTELVRYTQRHYGDAA